MRIRKRARLAKKQARMAEKRARRAKTVKQAFKRGITRTTIDLHKLTNQAEIKEAYKKLLKPVVKDEMLIDILSEESNAEKFRERLFTRLTLQGQLTDTKGNLTGDYGEIGIWKEHGKTIGTLKKLYTTPEFEKKVQLTSDILRNEILPRKNVPPGRIETTGNGIIEKFIAIIEFRKE